MIISVDRLLYFLIQRLKTLHHHVFNCHTITSGVIVYFYTQLRIRTRVIKINVLYFFPEVHTMADYQKMYYLICVAASKAIDAPSEEAKQLLQTALYEAEDMYIRTCGEDATQEEAKPRPQI